MDLDGTHDRMFIDDLTSERERGASTKLRLHSFVREFAEYVGSVFTRMNLIFSLYFGDCSKFFHGFMYGRRRDMNTILPDF